MVQVCPPVAAATVTVPGVAAGDVVTEQTEGVGVEYANALAEPVEVVAIEPEPLGDNEGGLGCVID